MDGALLKTKKKLKDLSKRSIQGMKLADAQTANEAWKAISDLQAVVKAMRKENKALRISKPKVVFKTVKVMVPEPMVKDTLVLIGMDAIAKQTYYMVDPR